MGETAADVRRDIEMTRERMSNTLTELERKLNVGDIVREHPWASLAVAVGAGVLLSGSGRDAKAATAAVAVTKSAGGKLASALDNVVASVVGGVHQALDERVRGWVGELKGAPRAADRGATETEVISVSRRAD